MNYAALTRHLETLGLADLDGVKLRARYSRCPQCAGEILSGLDADVAGLPRTLDVIDLDRVAELTVLLAGRATFRIIELPDGLRIARRDPETIRADAQPRPVVAEHRCGAPTPTSTAFRWRIPASTTTPDGAPPF